MKKARAEPGAARAVRRRASADAEPRLWIRIDLGGSDKMGPGKIALLRAVRDRQSISAAARALKMSYRRAWLLIDALNKSFGAPLVETHVGGSRQGGATLTRLGTSVVEAYDRIERAASAAARPGLRRLGSLRRRA